MSLFDRMKASIGIGAAKVDARLDNHNVVPGEEVTGEVYILGGNIPQEINGAYINIKTKVLKEVDDKKMYSDFTLFRFLVASQFTINSKEEKIIPFSFKFPTESPISLGNTKIWVQTELDIPLAVDPSDKDAIVVNPSISTRIVLDAIDSLGFVLRKTENLSSYKSSIGLIQEFEYFARSGEFKGLLDELEVIVIPDTYGVKLLLEVDRKVRGLGSLFAETFDMDETKITLTIDNEILDQGASVVAEQIRNIIHTYS
ncbi:sporulation protein [Bacillus thuringiensis]|uniref:sporulation protein n=1 Tax=Bacillus thuringiensis TaxID=1428 RepID=UPI0021D699F8|nr:sporulation protein [Bacillus thuringiensis]MCU7667121.1 sporulation protein [Bacillus thuringiensis]